MAVKVYPHGRNRFVVNQCRCDVCCEANRAYERERRQRIEPAYVAAGPARRHVHELAQAGVGLKRIAKCRACLVRDECRAANLDQRDGIYGAMSARARAELRAAEGLPAPQRVVAHGTNAGYAHHVRLGEPACRECLGAHARYVQDTRPTRSKGAA